jgi:hypothetical protein
VSRNAPTWLACLLLTLCSGWALGAAGDTPPPSPGTNASARVVIIRDPGAMDAFQPRPDRIKPMVDRAMTNLTGKPTPAEAWRSLVSTQDVVGIKVFSAPGPNSGTRPAVVGAVIEGLLAAGLPRTHIIIWDRQAVDLRLAGFYDTAERYGVRVASSAAAGYDEKVFYDSPLLGNLIWGDLEFGKKEPGVGRKSFVSKLITKELTKIINVTPLLNHNLAGVSGNLYGLAMGSTDNIARFESNTQQMTEAVPDICNLPALYDRSVLNIVDALICQYEGGEHGLLHYSAVLNELRFSRDPVALDVLSIRELEQQRQAAGEPSTKPSFELYDNAALIQLGVSDLKRIQVDRL